MNIYGSTWHSATLLIVVIVVFGKEKLFEMLSQVFFYEYFGLLEV